MLYIQLVSCSRMVNIFLKKLMNGNLTRKLVQLCYFVELRKLGIFGNSYLKALSLLWSGCLKQFLSLNIFLFLPFCRIRCQGFRPCLHLTFIDLLLRLHLKQDWYGGEVVISYLVGQMKWLRHFYFSLEIHGSCYERHS